LEFIRDPLVLGQADFYYGQINHDHDIVLHECSLDQVDVAKWVFWVLGTNESNKLTD